MLQTVFHSDNGGPMMASTTVNGSVNAPLRGSKRQPLEGGVRVPFLMSWKGRLPVGAVYDAPVIQLDIPPTALAAAGIEPEAGARFDGVNLLPFLTGQEDGDPHEALYWRFGGQTAIRKGNWKLVRYGRNAEIDPNEAWPKLYDLAGDVGESKGLAAERPEVVKDLEAAWRVWDGENVAPLRGPGGTPRDRR